MGKRKKFKKQAETEEAIEAGSANKIVISVVVVILAVVIGLSFKGGSKNSSEMAGVFPDFVYTSDNTVKAYTVADEMPEYLEKVPCYCSCVRVGHKSLKDCFLKSKGGYSDHGAYCNTCIYEALDVKKWRDQGLDIKEIRSRIDEKYGGGKFAEGTDTPPV